MDCPRTFGAMVVAAVLAAAPATAGAQYDWTIAGVVAPATASSGDSITVTAIESSAASAPLTRYPWVTFYLAADPSLTTGRIELCTTWIPLAPGASQPVSCSAQLSPFLATGTYYVGAVIDPQNFDVEPNEQDNTSTAVPIAVTQLPPDFSIGQLSVPARADAGAAITVTAVETSAAGSSFASTRPWVTFVLATDAPLASPVAELCTSWPALATGTSQTVTCNATLPAGLAAGTYYLGALVDQLNQWAESNEQNNVATGLPIAVGPDLVMSGLTGPDLARADAWITLADTVTNRGGAAGPFVVGYYLSSDPDVTTADLLLGTRTVSALAAGASSEATTPLHLPAGAAGRVYLAAIVDSALQVSEADEANNTSPPIAVDLVTDSTPPVITVTGVVDGETTNAIPLSVCYTATDDFLTSAEGSLDGVPFTGCVTVVADGLHALAVTASDFAGNVTTFEAHFVLDTTPPRVEITWPSIGAAVGTRVDVTAIASDVWDVATVEANGSSLGLGPDGAYHGTIQLHPSAPRVLVRATDVAGNVRVVTVPVVLDSGLPLVLTLASPAQGFEVATSSISVAGRVTGGAPPIALRIAGVAVSIAFDGSFATMLPVSAGPVEISVVATDAAGGTVSATVTGTCTYPGGDALPVEPARGAPPGTTRYLWDAAGNLSSIIDTSRDVNNCGQLDVHCPGVQNAPGACVAGQCGAMVGGQFVDVWSDPAHCGNTMLSCAVPANGTATCRDGTCGFQCNYGFLPSGFACVDVTSSPTHCGRLDRVCDEVGASCVQGACRVPGAPVVFAVNGVAAPGLAFRDPAATGIRVDGAHLDNVLAVWLEDWGPDMVGSDLAAPQLRLETPMMFVEFLRSPGQLVIPAAALQARAVPWAYPRFLPLQWYKLRLAYDVDGVPFQTVVDVAVSLDDERSAERLAPVITGVSRLEVRTVSLDFGYDPATGFVRLFDPRHPCGPDLLQGTPPIAVLAPDDPLQTEFPVFGVTREGVFIQAGLDPLRVQRVGNFEDNPWEVTLVYPYAGAAAELIDISGRRPSYSNCPWFGPTPAGLILRGTNLFADAQLSLVNADGAPLPGSLGEPVFLEDRILIQPTLDAPFSGIVNVEAAILLSSPRGSTVTPWPLQWRDVPVIESIGPRSFVAYDEVMVLTGRFFTGARDVSLGWAGRFEHLTRVETSPPGPEQFHVIDEHRVELRLSGTGGPVPRPLAAVCVNGAPLVDVFPGAREFTLANEVGSASATTSAVDPAGPVVIVPTPLCAHLASGGGGSSAPPPSAPPMVGPSVNPIQLAPGNGGCTNSICN